MKHIEVSLLKEMLLSASNNLYNHYPEIDALNVFPVPDGDTGMNMNLTLTSGAKEIQNRNDTNVYDLAKAFARGLLMGARGNSGVITSQIFRGFADSLKDKKSINASDLVNAFISAKETAYKAVIKPVEGTILTVVRESADYVAEHRESYTDADAVFKAVLVEARNSLKRTPELLPVLKEVGVVDSGGQGYVTILEGMYSALKGLFVNKNAISALAGKEGGAQAALEDEEFGYCTEFIMTLGPDTVKKQFNKKRFITTLSTKGNSMVVVQDEDIVKVHIHTMTPGWVLNYAQQFGEFKKLKIENMTEQHSEIMMAEEAKRNETAPKAEDVPLKEYAMIAVSPGEGITEMFKEIGVDEIVSGGQTMNPSTEDFVAAINRVHAKRIFIFPNNSNIVMAASQACDVIDEEIDARVIPSSTIPQGLVAAMNFNPELNSDENYNAMKGSLKTVKSAQVTYAIKDTEIDGVEVKKDYYMALVNKKIIACVKDKYDALFTALDGMIDEDSAIITLFTGEDISDEEHEELASKLEEKYDSVDIDIRKGNQPVYSFIIGVE